MTPTPIDNELLAAFLDGTTTPEGRAVVVQRLASDRELHARFVELAAIRRDLDGVDADAAPVAVTAAPTGPEARPNLVVSSGATASPVPVPARRPRWLAPAILLAAGIAIMVVWSSSRSRSGDDAVLLMAQATHVAAPGGAGSLSNRLGATWNAPPWSVSRGGAAESAETATRAYRAGVYAAQLEAAGQSRDGIAIRQAAESLRALLADVNGSAPMAAELSALGASEAEATVASRRAILFTQLRVLLESPEWFDLGLWTSTARLAALDGQAGYLALTGPAADAMTALAKRVPVAAPAQWSNAIQSAQALIGQPTPPLTLAGQLTALIAAAGL